MSANRHRPSSRKPRSRAVAIAPVAETGLSTDLREAASRAADFASKSRADSTLRAYRIQWDAFCSWCAARKLSCLPAEPAALLLYVTEREMAGAGLSTVFQIVAAVAYRHRQAEQPLPTTDQKLRSVLEGMMRVKGVKPQRRAAPLSPEQLELMCAAASGGAQGARDRALVLLGWAAARRRSEIAAWDLVDVAEEATGVLVTVRRSKTDQRGEGLTVGVLLQPEEKRCPVRALRGWLEYRGTEPGPLFQSVLHGKPTGRRLDGKDVLRIVRRLAQAAGFRPELVARVSAHSLRAGFATTAAKRGKSPFAIAKQGGWSSLTTLQRYVRDAGLLDDDNPTRGLM